MKTTIATLISIAMLGACTSDKPADYNPQLPAITQTGANTFGCKINGVIMIPRDAKIEGVPGGTLPKGIEYSSNRNDLYNLDYEQIEAKDCLETNRGALFIKLYKVFNKEASLYPIANVIGGFSADWGDTTYIQVLYKNAFYGSIENTGNVQITKYTKEIISGTFSCTLKNKNNPNDVIEITDGRFDFSKPTINSTKFL
nr:hypothetical protein [uncultured Flavobacterium sp.]